MKYIVGLLLILGLIISACAQEMEPSELAPEQTQKTQPVAVMEPPKTEPTVPKGDFTVQVLGKAGFDPMEVTINTGDTVEFINTMEKEETLVFKMTGKVAMENTPIIKPGKSFIKEFDAPGVFEYWAVGFGPAGAKITVE